LSMLADEDLISEQASEDQRRKVAITSGGQQVLADEAEQATQARNRRAELGEREERHRAPSNGRAAANLVTAIGQRMRDGRGSEEPEELPHRIAEILDEAARKIERL